MKVLHDRELADAVRALFDGEDKLRCAVAFWGPDHARLARKRCATVILDLSMRCVSKAALKAFGVRSDRVPTKVAERVLVLDGLHAKLYLSRDTAIIGSANASCNALGRSGSKPVLREAGVLIERRTDARAFKDAERLWKAYVGEARPVTVRDLELAPLFPPTPAASDWSAQGGVAASVLDASLRRPNDFARTAFVFGDHDIKGDELKIADVAYVEKHGVQPSSHGRSFICTIEDKKDDSVRILKESLNIVSYWFGRAARIYAYHDLDRVEHGAEVSFYGIKKWRTVRESLGLFDIRRDDAWATDRETAFRLLETENEPVGRRYIVMTAGQVREKLERTARRE